MQSLSQVTLYEFQKVLTPERMKAARLVQMLIGLTPVLMTVAFMWIATNQGNVEPRENALETVTLLTWIHAAVAAVLYGFATWMSRRSLTEESLKSAAEKPFFDKNRRPVEDPAEKCYLLLLRSMIIRMALFEATALVGLMVILIAMRMGVLGQYPFFWLNLLTLVILIVVTARTIPSKERFEQIFRDRIVAVH